MRSTFRILFYVNKQRAKDGRVPIYVRLTINSKSTFVSSRQTIPLSLWDSAANKASGKSREAQEINRKLEHIRAQIERYYQRTSDKDTYVSAERVKPLTSVWVRSTKLCWKFSTSSTAISNSMSA